MFAQFPLVANVLVFAIAAAVVWAAGTRIAHYADAIAEATGIGRAVLGILLLGAVTSLPELAVASTAALAGHPELSVNDLLGSAAINVLVIAVADAVVGRDAITSIVASPPVLLQGVLGIILLAVVAAGTMSVDVAIFGASAWTWSLVALYAGAVWLIARSHSDEAWRPARSPHRHAAPSTAPSSKRSAPSMRGLISRTAIAGIAVLIAGFFLAKSAEAIAVQTGLGTSFVGAVLLAASTSLPEVSTVLAAVKLKRYEMALSDVLGTNLFNVTIVFVVDALYDGEPVLAKVGRFAGFGALLAIVLTALFVAGMIERRDRTIARMGLDSLLAIVVYGAGVTVLYQLR